MKAHKNKIGIISYIISIIILFPCLFFSVIYAGFIGYFLFFIFLYINIYLHEFGHVLAGKLVNFEIRSIIIGDGKQLIHKKIKGISIIINIGFIGFTTATIKTRNFVRLRMAIFTIGGLLINTILALLSWELKANLLKVLALSNIYLLITNFFPVNFYRKGIKIPNDGLSLIKIPFMKEKDINEQITSHEIYEAFELINKKNYESAKKILRNYVERFPKFEILHINYSVCLIKCLELTDAKEILLNLINEKSVNEYDCVIYNNLAYTYLLINSEELLLVANKYSKMAFELRPDIPSIQSTRGTILIEIGDVDEGIRILENNFNSRNKSDDISDKINTIIYLAYAYHQKVDEENMKKYLDIYKKYLHKSEPDHILLYNIIRYKTKNFSIQITSV